MGTITVKEVDYENYGKCKVLSNGLIEVYVTVDVGPRIIKLNLCGKDNLVFNDIGRNASEDVSSVFGEGKKWYIYGGHRLWVSPEHMPKTYYPDNDPVDFRQINDNTFLFTPAAQKVNNLQHSLEIGICPVNTPEMKVTHKVENIGGEAVTGAIWALSVMAPGGTVICPQPDEDTGLLGNRLLALWPYTKFTDSRSFYLDKYIFVKQNPAVSDKFKFGINNTKGWIAYQNHGQLMKKSYTPNHPNGNYPDGGMSTEVFTNNLFIEAETLSELKTIAKGEAITHTEQFRLSEAPNFDFHSMTQAELEGYVAKYC